MSYLIIGLKIVGALIPLLLGAGYLYLSRLRTLPAELPRPKRGGKSFVLGDLALIDEHIKKVGKEIHVDNAFLSIMEENGNPPYLLLDTAPVMNATLIVIDGPFAEQVHKPQPDFPYGLPKSETFLAFSGLFGKTSMLMEYDNWKPLRKRYNPGFQPQFIFSQTPAIIDQTLIASRILEQSAKKGELVKIVDVMMRLGFDIIGYFSLEETLGAQNDPDAKGEYAGLGRDVFDTFNDMRSEFLNDKLRIQGGLIGNIRKYFMERRLDRQIKAIIDKKIESGGATMERSVIGLTLKEDPIPPMQEMIDQVKTFLFGGHDTMAATLSWAIYKLSTEPHMLSAVLKEIDRFFPPSSTNRGSADRQFEVAEALRAMPELINKLDYVDALLKETLRIYVPASTVRAPQKNKPFSMNYKGEILPLTNITVYPINLGIHTNERGWGPTAKEFRPERWLGKEFEEKTSAIVAEGWYRPFERAPRTCIGQGLAMVEMKVVLVLLSLRMEFVHEGRTPFLVHRIVGKPCDEMPMRVKLRD